MRIRTIIFGVYVAACAVGYIVLMWFMLAEVRPRYVHALRANLDDTAHALAAALADRTLDEAAAALASPASFRVRLVTGDGDVRHDSATAETDAKAGLEVSVSADLRLAGDDRARLVLSRSFRNVNAVIWSERARLAGGALVIAAVMVLAGWWLAARLTRSLERLTVHARRLRDGRPSRPPDSRAKEIADLARAFEEMRDALEGRQHVERYTQSLAHEVKAPLAAIRGAAELIDEDMPPDQRRKFLAHIRTEAARIQHLVERLLELSSLEARKALRRTETVSLPALAREAVAAVQGVADAARVRIETHADNATVTGERVLLREALVNLLHNAVEFSPAGSIVTLTLRTAVGHAEFTVEDEGAGVPDYALPRVFERFYSLPRPRTTRRSTGLGLALVREIALLHGGDSHLENRAGGGTRAGFTVRHD